MAYSDSSNFTVKRVLAFDTRNGYGWRHTTPEQAATYHHDTVRADSRLFKCECCGSYVLFTAGTIQARHFRHTPNDPQAKYCPQHSFVTIPPAPSPLPEVRTAPIKLDIKREELRVSIGLRSLPFELYESIRNATLEIVPSQGKVSRFSLSERLYPFGTTYFDNLPLASSYNFNLSVKNIEGLSHYWPTKIRGINSFAFFDAKSKRLVPPEGNLVVNRDYYFISRIRNRFINQYGISLNKSSDFIQGKSYNNGQWYLYRFSITDFSQFWSDLLKEKFNLTLSTRPPLLYPIWPPNVTNGDVLMHNEIRTFLFAQGSVQFEAYPNRNFVFLEPTPEVTCFHIPFHQSVLRVENETRKVFSIGGQKETIKQIYYFRKSLSDLAIKELPQIRIYAQNVLLSEEEYDVTPKRLEVHTEWNGRIDVKKSNRLIDRIPLQAGSPCTFKPIPGCEYQFYQGVDFVRKLYFNPKVASLPQNATDDASLLRQLERCRGVLIPIPHSSGGTLALKMNNYPLVKTWFFKALRMNKIPQDAWMIIKKNFT